MTTSIETIAHDAQVPVANGEGGRILQHEYDGIREYDNPMPSWWKLIFAGTVAFAAAYGFYFHVVDRGELPDQAYRAQLAEYESKREIRARAEAANVSESSLAQAANNSDVLARGAAAFEQRCASCHGNKGEGLIGPNLTDSRQLHGSTRMDLYQTISSGVAGTAMLAWGEQMSRTDVLAVTAHVIALRGTNVPGKEPQGKPVEKFAP